MKLYYIAKKVSGVASDIVGFLVQKKPGVRLTIVGDLLIAAGPRLGANVARVIGELLIAAGPKGAVAVNENVSGSAKAEQVPAISANNLSAGSNAPPTQADGSKVTQVTYDLVRDQAATGSAVTGDWQSPSNAQGSSADSNMATLEGAALRRTGTLLLSYADPSGKDEFSIDKVEMVAYYRTSGTVVTNTTFELRYNVDGDVIVRSWSGNQSFLTTPLTVNITGDRAWTWADLVNLTAEVYGLIDSAGNGVLFEVDVVYFRITASKTDIL